MPPTPEQLRDLCTRLLACEDEEAAIVMAEQLRSALHEHVQKLREQLKALHAQAPSR